MKKIEGQHGDVILEVVESIPEGAVKVESQDGFIVERGEGVHTHTLHPMEKKDENESFEIWMLNNEMYIKVIKESYLDHEEHKTKTLKKGLYKRVIEREFDYEKEIERRVID